MAKVKTGQSRYVPGTEQAKRYGAALRVLREASGISQAKAGTILGSTQQTIARWESGQNFPQVHDIPIMARLYKCSVSDLLPPVPDDIIIALRQLDEKSKPE